MSFSAVTEIEMLNNEGLALGSAPETCILFMACSNQEETPHGLSKAVLYRWHMLREASMWLYRRISIFFIFAFIYCLCFVSFASLGQLILHLVLNFLPMP
jgi:hypothetical protein